MREFERQHDLEFEYAGVASCGVEGMYSDIKINTWLEYRTPSHFSRYGIVYELLIRTTYVPDSQMLSLRIPDSGFLETEDVLQFIDALEVEVAKFESDPQVEEFSTSCGEEGIDIRGTVYSDSLWIEIDPSFGDSRTTPSVSARIFYSMSTHSITFYSLPNRMVWEEFPELLAAHVIISQNLLAGELSGCLISKENRVGANTAVNPKVDGSTGVDVKLVCDETGEDGYLILTLYPDGSYDYEYKEAYRQLGE